MTEMKSRQKNLITIGVILVSIGVLLGGAVYPIFKGVTKDHEEMLKQRYELLQMNEEKKLLHNFESISLQYEQEFLRIQDLFVDRETPVSFFRFLDQAAVKFGLDIEKAPDNPAQKEGDVWPSLEVRIVGSGLYSNFLAFLQTIENAPYVMEIQTLNITKSQQGLAEENVTFALSLKVFVR
jgi:hypothetical protein